jgi:hypothetical protein
VFKIIFKKKRFYLKELKKGSIFAPAFKEYLMRHAGEMAEWSNAAVLKTVEGHTSGGSNPSFSAEFMFQKKHKTSKTF